MPRDPRAWRIEKFEELGFAHHEAVALADSRDRHGVPVYWGKVKRALEDGASHALLLDFWVEPPEGVKV